MEFSSILDLKENFAGEETRSPFYLDLNIDQIINNIKLAWGSNISGFYYYFPADMECENYRRAIFQDVKNRQIYDILNDFVGVMLQCDEIMHKKEEVRIKIQKAVWHVVEACFYSNALSELHQQFEENTFTSKGMNDFKQYIKEYTTSESFIKMQQEAQKLYEELNAYRFVITYDKGNLVLASGKVEGKYENFLNTCCPDRDKQMKSPFMKFSTLTQLEQELIKIVMKKEPEFFKRVEEFNDLYGNFRNAVIMRFSHEITFYLSFSCFEQMMMEKGHVFSTPSIDEAKPMEAKGLYDLALACANLRNEKSVVCNEFIYHDEERFFVLTGPNQGGKTTFARSLGQLVYFTKMGLDVPATSANLHFFQTILTHFSVEESIETGRGKLMEELKRLAPMMRDAYEDTFIIINELFTTAANHDACIMGEKVLKHFVGKGCKGIYVTHLRELSELGNGVVSIRAALDENRMQSFRIIRGDADDTACAQNQVNKYKLTYEQLKERLGGAGL